MATKRPRKKNSSNPGFEQYRLNGMIANLHTIYYDRRKGSPSVLTQIGLTIDCLEALKIVLKEHNDDASK